MEINSNGIIQLMRAYGIKDFKTFLTTPESLILQRLGELDRTMVVIMRTSDKCYKCITIVSSNLNFKLSKSLYTSFRTQGEIIQFLYVLSKK